MKRNSDVWIVCGVNFESKECTYQMLTKARTLCEKTGGKIVAVWIGKPSKDDMLGVFQYGADKLIIYIEEKNSHITLSEKAKKEQPGLILLSSSESGRFFASALSISLGGGLVADCIEIHTDKEYGYIFTRAAICASVTAQIVCIQTQFCICTVKRNVFPISLPNLEAEIGVVECCATNIITKQMEPIILRSKSLPKKEFVGDLQNSRLVFGFGRGIGGNENLELLKKIAKAYKAELVGSRAVVEEGFIVKERQVGQSGISISPSIYITFGISGASQHMVGVKNAETIIAVNKDRNAPIFAFSDYRIVEDCTVVLKRMEQLLVEEHYVLGEGQ